MQLRAIRRIGLASLGGKPAATGDERAHFWVVATLSGADEAHRAAEDQLFIVGQPDFDIRLAAAVEV